MVIFGTYLSVMENPGVHKKVEYRFTTTNLPLCNDKIIVLKITLLHGVSVITNFVVPKRDKQSKKETSHFFVYSRRATPITTILSMVIEEVRAIFAAPS